MCGLLSKTMISRSGRRRLAWAAALIPAASPPTTTSLSVAMAFAPFNDFRCLPSAFSGLLLAASKSYPRNRKMRIFSATDFPFARRTAPRCPAPRTEPFTGRLSANTLAERFQVFSVGPPTYARDRANVNGAFVILVPSFGIDCRSIITIFTQFSRPGFIHELTQHVCV